MADSKSRVQTNRTKQNSKRLNRVTSQTPEEARESVSKVRVDELQEKREAQADAGLAHASMTGISPVADEAGSKQEAKEELQVPHVNPDTPNEQLEDQTSTGEGDKPTADQKKAAKAQQGEGQRTASDIK